MCVIRRLLYISLLSCRTGYSCRGEHDCTQCGIPLSEKAEGEMQERTLGEVVGVSRDNSHFRASLARLRGEGPG